MAPSAQHLLYPILVFTVGVIGERTRIYVGGFLPVTGFGFPIYPVAGPAVDLAVELINNSTDVLPNYELQLEIFDTEVCVMLHCDCVWSMITLKTVRSVSHSLSVC